MDNSIPYITIEAKNNLLLLGDNPIPGLIVEGKTDTSIYDRILINSSLDWHNIDIVIGGCKSEIIKQYELGIDFQYLILLDSDYERYNNKLKKDEKIIYTHFYNMENYLTTSDVVDNTINDFNLAKFKRVNSIEILDEAIAKIESYVAAILFKMDNNLSIELENLSLENNNYWNSKLSRIDNNKFKNYLIDSCNNDKDKQLLIAFRDKYYDSYKNKVYELLKDGKIDLILNGKPKLRAIYYVFRNKFKYAMKYRDINCFIVDLSKNLIHCGYIQDLVEQIDNEFSKSLMKECVSL